MMVLPLGIEPRASALSVLRSTTELRKYGTGGGPRTPKTLRPPVPKTGVSAYSTTPALVLPAGYDPATFRFSDGRSTE